jgi:hypothetical protein
VLRPYPSKYLEFPTHNKNVTTAYVCAFSRLRDIPFLRAIYPFFIPFYYTSSYYQPLYNDIEDQPDEFLIDLIARYGQTIMNARNDLEK